MTLVTLLLAAAVAAVPAKAPRKRQNMPTGWSWPPSPAMVEAGVRCKAGLDAARLEYREHEPVKKVATPIVVPGRAIGGIALVSLKRQRREVMDCHLAAALLAAAPALRELGVRALHYRQMHEHRRIRKGGRSLKALSRHALGLAVDVFEVAFDDGEVLKVKRHWRRHGRRLAKVAAAFAGTPEFRTPLTPANDPADHGDHLHLEVHMPL